MASEKITEKGRRIAARMLEAAEGDIEFAGGRFTVTGTDRSLPLMDVARQARTDGTPLDTYQHFTREYHTFPNGCHIAEVKIDRETGAVTLTHYTTVDDFGTIINPLLVAGQVHGAVAQGVGQALFEQAVYALDSGQLLSGSFMDYCMPRADDLPFLEVAFNSVSCTTNPLGVKGSGEAGAIAGFPAVANAVLDALDPFGVTVLNGPATPENVWRLLNPNR